MSTVPNATRRLFRRPAALHVMVCSADSLFRLCAFRRTSPLAWGLLLALSLMSFGNSRTGVCDTWRPAGLKSDGRLLNGVWFADSSRGWAVGNDGLIRCTTDGGASWSVQASGTTKALYDVWGVDASNIWIVGESGTILKYNGSSWVPQTSNTTWSIHSVWGTDTSNVWAVGQTGTILKYNGTSWSAQTSGTSVNLNSLWGSGASSIWAVGASGTILKYDGASWSAQTSGTAQALNDVYGADASNVWAVGNTGTILKWSGSSWSAQTSGISVTLNSIWGSDGSNLWITGNAGAILKYNGSSWSTQSSGVTQNLFGAWGTSSSQVWAVGGSGTIVKYNGTSWGTQSASTAFNCLGIWGTSTSNIWTTGGSGIVLRYDGTSWTPQDTGSTQTFLAIWGSDASNIWVCGGGNGTILKYNGSTWGAQASGTTNALQSMWGTSSTNVWAVGDFGTIRKYDGSSWGGQTSNTTEHLNGVWGTDASNIWAVGANGTILKWNGTSWSAQASGTTETLYGVWGLNASNIWAVGANGVILKFNGTSWSAQTSGSTVQLNGVWGSDASHVWAVGNSGTILKWNGSNWSPDVSNTSLPRNAIWGTDATHVFVAGNLGLIQTNEPDTPPNTTPTVKTPALPDVSVNEDAANSVISLRDYFTDTEDGSDLTYSVQGNTNTVIFSSVSVNAGDDRLTLDYAPNANGSADITIRATDSGGGFVDDTFRVTVNAVNDDPVVANDIDDFAVDEDAANTVIDLENGANRVFTDVDGDTLTYSVVSNSTPSLLTASIANDILTLDYAPNQSGTATVKIRASDPGNKSAEDTFVVTVRAVNDAPVALDATRSTSEDTALTVDLATLVSDAESADSDLIYSIESQPAQGAGSVALNGSVTTYTPATNFNGQASFTYKASDPGNASSDIKTVSITVNAVNDTPVATDGATTMAEDTSVDLDLATLVSDIEDGDAALVYSIVAPPAAGQGSTALNGSVVTFSPGANFNGQATFTYRVTDTGQSRSTTQTITVTVTGTNDQPFVVREFLEVKASEDGVIAPISFEGIFDDPDLPYGDELVLSVSSDNEDLVTVSLSDTIGLTLKPNASGTATITVHATDKAGAYVETTILVTVGAVNDAPVALDGTQTTDEDNSVQVDLATLVSDVESAATDLTYSIQSQPTAGKGSVALNGSTATYTPAPDYNGAVTFTYKATDSDNGSSSVKTITITVRAVNDVPRFTLAGDAPAVDEDSGAQTVNRFATGIAAGPGDEADQTTGFSITDNTNPDLFAVEPKLSSSGVLTYTPAADAFGSAVVKVEMFDTGGTERGGEDTSSEQSFTITVNAVNDAPAGRGDTATTAEDTAVEIAVVANDIDVDHADTQLRVAADSIAGVKGGTAVLLADGRTIRFTPAPHAHNGNTPGGFGFSYKASDGSLASNSTTAVVTVSSVNDEPDAVNDAPTVPFNSISQLAVLGNDTDVDGDTLAIVSVTQPAHGTRSINNNGTPGNTGDDKITYTPATGYVGSDSFTYTISDGKGGQDTATVTLDVSGVNVTWSVSPTFSGSTAVLVYKVKNLSDALLSNLSASLPLCTSAVRASLTAGKWAEKSVGSGSALRYQGTWSGFSLSPGQEATLTLLRSKPSGSQKPVADPAGLTFSSSGSGKIPAPTTTVKTP